MDIYSTRAQLAAIEQMPREYSALFDLFVKDRGPIEDDKAIYDYKKGSRKMAPTVRQGAGGVLMERDGFETREIGFCTVAPERIVESQNLKDRIFGEKVLGAMTPAERAKKIQARDLVDMRRASQRRYEWMTMQVLTTGKLQVFNYTNEGRGINPVMIADYGFTNFYTPDTKWSDAGADIEGDMERIFDLVYDGSGYVDRIVFAPDVAAALLGNEKFMKHLDRKNENAGKINAQYKGQGLRYIGINADGSELYSLSGTYVDDDGVVKPLIPAGQLIAGSADVLNAYFGPVTQVEGSGNEAQYKTYIKKQVPLRYGSTETNAVKNRLTSRPTIVPFNVDAWAVGKVM